VPKWRAQGTSEGSLRTPIWGADPDEFSPTSGYALGMVVEDPQTRNALQAVAFGRVVTPEDQAAAARALEALRELDERASAARVRAVGVPAVPVPSVGGARRAGAIGAGGASGPVTVEVVDDSQAVRDDAWRAGPSRIAESLRRFWVVPVIVASLALGAVGGSVATRAAAEKPPASLAPAAQATEPSGNGEPSDSDAQGDAAAAADSVVPPPSQNYVAPDSPTPDPSAAAAAIAGAESWLSQPQLGTDIFPNESSLTSLGADPGSAHLVTSDSAMSIWVVRGKSDGLCLAMVVATDESFELSCVPEDQFPIVGVSIGTPDGASAHWDANGVDYGYGPSASG
jgi:hypothetical protein